MARAAGELQEDAHVAFRLEPVGARRLRRREPDQAPVELLALDGDEERVAVRITGDELDVETERIAQQNGHVIARRAFAGAAENERRSARAARIRNRGDRSILAHE